ncbi:hypothetical protein BDV23DRAFT_29129 [Aspergillus alliaceus]|uniref:Transcription factor domain-containing protein n=2 Tax=Petromyces alliaceus TaxID=209559 RepID=A0A5N7CJ34_PETAA|nr:hypothetical protein BDV23DRAFT_29129 [Aspergillus alliaceus]
MPPWDTRSEFSSTISSLLLFESYSKVADQSIWDSIDRKGLGHRIFAQTLFHLCHCLLNHPFLLHLRLKPFGCKAPRSFAARALQMGVDHAVSLVGLLRDAFEAGCLVESSFYAYCFSIATGIFSVASHAAPDGVAYRPSEMLCHVHIGLEALERLAHLWVHAANMSVRLREFHAQSHCLTTLLDPACLADDLDPASEDMLWSMIDYALLGEDPRKTSQAMGSEIPILPSPTSWALDAEILAPVSSIVDASHGNLFSAMTPTLRLNEVEYFLNCSSPNNGVL